MKKLFVLFVVVFTTCSMAMAQPRAIGVRLGLGGEASYQHSLGSNMLQADVGLFGWWGIEAAVTYNWLFPIGAGNWNWYAGVGGGAGFSWWGYGFFGAAGMLGIEYNFGIPLQLSLDYRPIIGPGFGGGGLLEGGSVFFNTMGLYAGSIALGVRYRF